MKSSLRLPSSLAVLICLAASAEAKPPQAPAVENASFRYLSWGATVHYWTIDAAGAVVWEAPEGPVSMPPSSDQHITIAIKRFQLDESRRAALAAAIARAEKAASLSEKCDSYIPDGPYGRLTWTRSGAEHLSAVNASCMKGPQAEKAGAAFAADRIVREAAEGAAVVDRRQE